MDPEAANHGSPVSTMPDRSRFCCHDLDRGKSPRNFRKLTLTSSNKGISEAFPLRLRTRVFDFHQRKPGAYRILSDSFSYFSFFASAFISNLEEYTILPCHMVRLKLLFRVFFGIILILPIARERKGTERHRDMQY